MTMPQPIRQVVLDIETTGLDPASGDRVIEIAAVELLDSQVSGRHLHTYINPECEIADAAVAIHGITLDMLLDKPRFSEVAGGLTDFLQGAELIVHNAPFDVGFINNELTKAGMSTIETLCPSVVDTLSMARKLRPTKANTISALCRDFGIEVSRKSLHGALLDAYLLADVYLHLMGRFSTKGRLVS